MAAGLALVQLGCMCTVLLSRAAGQHQQPAAAGGAAAQVSVLGGLEASMVRAPANVVSCHLLQLGGVGTLHGWR